MGEFRSDISAANEHDMLGQSTEFEKPSARDDEVLARNVASDVRRLRLGCDEPRVPLSLRRGARADDDEIVCLHDALSFDSR
jgi:hypothetical protein